MKYINPLNFLPSNSIASEEGFDKKSLLLQKKKLLAEIELSDDKTVTVEGSVFTKNDLIQLFDRLQQSEELTFHTAIAQDKVLTHFLETGELLENGKFLENDLYSDPDFISFIAPYYEERFTKKVLQYLKDVDVYGMEDLFANPLFLDGPHHERSFTKIMRFLLQKKSYLLQTKDVAVTSTKVKHEHFSAYIDPNFIAILNLLPEEFEEFRSDYGLELINTGIALQNVNLKLAVNILAAVRDLRTNDYIQEQNDERYEILSKNLKGTSRWSIGYWKTWLIVFFVFRLIYAATTCNNSTTPKYSYSPTLTETEVPFDKEVLPNNKLATAHFNSNKTFNYSKSFVNALSEHSKEVAASGNKWTLREQPVIESGTNIYKENLKALGIRRSKKTSTTGDYIEEVTFENESSFETVALIQTKDSLFSCYVRPFDNAKIKVPDGVTVIYFYCGNYWNGEKELMIKSESKTEYPKPVKIKGTFNEITAGNAGNLRRPFLLNVDNTTQSTQDHRSFFTIKNSGDDAKISFETLSSQRINMERIVM